MRSERSAKNKPKKKHYAKGLFSTIGHMAGSYLGGSGGAAIGSKMGQGLGDLLGFGSYKPTSNSMVGTRILGDHNAADVFRRSVFISDVTSGTGAPSVFNTVVLPIQPGQVSFDPWLSSIAKLYDEYEVVGLVYEYRTSSGMATGANTALGTVIMATQYDPYDAPFANKLQMENYEFAASARPSTTFFHAVECARDKTTLNKLYIRPGAVIGDLRWTDFGNFTIATVGCPTASQVLGELWMHYEIKLRKPNYSNPLVLGSDHFVVGGATTLAASVISNFNTSLGTVCNLVSANVLGFAFPFLQAGTVLNLQVSVTYSGLPVVPAVSLPVNITPGFTYVNHFLVGVSSASVTTAILNISYVVLAAGTSSMQITTTGVGTFTSFDGYVTASRAIPTQLW